jgi:hypothetical protein
MNNHTITIERIPSCSNLTSEQDYQAKCSCGWVSNQNWLQATVCHAAYNHMSAEVIISTA